MDRRHVVSRWDPGPEEGAEEKNQWSQSEVWSLMNNNVSALTRWLWQVYHTDGGRS